MASTGIRHRVTAVDEVTRRGTCSECGPVAVAVGPKYQGRSYWRCAQSRNFNQNSRYHQDETYRETQRNDRFFRKYGITLDEYNDLIEKQDGTCARCHQEPQTRRLAVDHCHASGRVRGLLCGPCNTYLGRLEANLGLLSQDLAYIDACVIAERL